jgi:hypothetical protein
MAQPGLAKVFNRLLFCGHRLLSPQSAASAAASSIYMWAAAAASLCSFQDSVFLILLSLICLHLILPASVILEQPHPGRTLNYPSNSRKSCSCVMISHICLKIALIMATAMLDGAVSSWGAMPQVLHGMEGDRDGHAYSPVCTKQKAVLSTIATFATIRLLYTG